VKLNERLNEFVGHEIGVVTCNDEGEAKIPMVILEEVGEDYIVVRSQYNKDTQYSPPNERRVINFANVVQIVHTIG
jgi:hypothetical protein